MSTQLALLDGHNLVPDNDALRERLIRAGLSNSSIRRYLGASRSWLQYCLDHEEPAHDASTMALVRWLDSRCRASSSPKSAIRISLAAARFVQRAYALDQQNDPMPYLRKARAALDAYSRSVTLDRTPKRRARPLRVDVLCNLVASVRGTVSPRSSVSWDEARYLAARDSALVLACWWGALRADDAAQLSWSDVSLEPQGLHLTLRTSKTGPAEVACAVVPNRGLCPRAAIEELRQLNVTSVNGRLFGLTTGMHVARRLKTIFERHGAAGYTSHSLRSGFATECASQGVPDRLVQLHARWSSAQQHSEYVRSGRLWVDTPTSRLVVPTAPASQESVAQLFP